MHRNMKAFVDTFLQHVDYNAIQAECKSRGVRNCEWPMSILIWRFLNTEFSEQHTFCRVSDLPSRDIVQCIRYLGVCCGLSFNHSFNHLEHLYLRLYK